MRVRQGRVLPQKMGLFDKFRTGSNQQKLLEVWERVEILEREQKNLRMEWNNAYDKLNHMMARIARRAEKMHELAESEGLLAPSDDHAAMTAAEALTLNRLGPHQRKIQEQILLRRRALNGGK